LEVNTDVTAARAAEQALAESEQRFRAQFTQSAAGQIVRALDGSLIDVNPAYAAMLGYTTSQLVGTSERDLLHPADLAGNHHEIAALFAGDADSYAHQGRLRHADGHWVDVAATVSVVREANGRPKHFIGVFTDISARLAAEQARDEAAAALAERNTELERANQLKLDLIGMLGHEIGNPLAAILGYSEVLADCWQDLSPQRRGRAVDGIARQSHRLDQIVREVLAMVSIDASSISARRQPGPLCAQIAVALTAMDSEAVPVSGDDVTVLVNPEHLQHMLTNLVSNAAKYGGGATAVRIVRAEGRVRIRVEDRGPGVPDEFRPKLFQRLARADRDAGSVRGTGLGLYIVRSLARANHGDVHHEPNPAGGSVFVIDLEEAPPD
jgi:PAS domain S-box-containing protein